MSEAYETRPSKKWTAEMDDALEKAVMEVFSEHFKKNFTTYKELIEFYSGKGPRQLGSCWTEISKKINTQREAACKRFLNSHVRRYLQTWPKEIMDKVLADVTELTRQQSRLDLNMERALVIQMVEQRYKLKEMTQYHYPYIYSQMYSRIKQIQGQYIHDDNSDNQIPRTHAAPTPPQQSAQRPQAAWIQAQLTNHNQLSAQVNLLTDPERQSESSANTTEEAQDAVYQSALLQLRSVKLILPHLSIQQQKDVMSHVKALLLSGVEK